MKTITITITGNGPVALLLAYRAWLQFKNQPNTQLVIQCIGKNPVTRTTGGQGSPSLSSVEAVMVVPPPKSFIDQLSIHYKNGGLLDPAEVNQDFAPYIEKLQSLAADPSHDASHHETILTEFGQSAMQSWRNLAGSADDEFQELLQKCQYTPEAKPGEAADEQRFDIWFDNTGAELAAQKNVERYRRLGFTSARIVSPDQMQQMDARYAKFVEQYSETNPDGNRVWKAHACAIIRPGGCIKASQFVADMQSYLERKLGFYTDDSGIVQPSFQMVHAEVTKVLSHAGEITGLQCADGTILAPVKSSHHHYFFCPGDQITGFANLGFDIPPVATISGTSLRLKIPASVEALEQFKQLRIDGFRTNGTTSVCQVAAEEGQLVIHVSGLKGFGANNQAFVESGAIQQMGMLCAVYPHLIQPVLDAALFLNATESEKSTMLHALMTNNIAQIYLGKRALTPTGLPIIGHLRTINGELMKNAIVLAALGSAGWSLSAEFALLGIKLLMESAPKLRPSQTPLQALSLLGGIQTSGLTQRDRKFLDAFSLYTQSEHDHHHDSHVGAAAAA